ncbi:MAG TPA: hypothetical protein VHN79_07095 [Lacunisphaera sp.]|nr:hypothetical protein [Lacunisphaera sp.]
MQTQLPPAKSFRQYCNHQNGWSDHYGSFHVASAYAGLAMPSRYTVNGIWQHGVFGPWQQFSPHVLVYNAPGAPERPVFVARQDEAELMRRSGYKQVRAIGMPILYAPEPQVERAPGSLLVVPTHSLTGDNHADRSLFGRYADSIKALIGHFQKITVCIHPNCRRNGLWIKEFSVPNIEIVYGAETGDANALLRMRSLFAQFEFVTTNEWGSHVAYALAFGTRVSIAGQPIAGDPALYARDLMWQNNAAMMATAFSPEVAAARRKFLERLYVPTTEGCADITFGRWLVGADNRVSPDEMRGIMKVMVSSQVLVDQSTSSRHDQIRRQAAELVKAGLQGEATQLLMKYLQSVVESKQPRLILDTLTFVAKDLESLDSVKAAYLREQAQKLSSRIANAA